MTQIFNEAGIMVPVTVVLAGPMTVVRKKTVERDGYDAVVVAFGETNADKLNAPDKGVFEKSKLEPKKYLKEFKYSDCGKYEVGNTITCDMFTSGDVVDASVTSKGHGFTGAIKRWNHHRLKETHGSGPVVRQRGSMGARCHPGRVIKGLHSAGHWGHEKVTIQNLKVVKVDKDKNVLLIKGAIPGPNGGLVTIRQAVKK